MMHRLTKIVAAAACLACAAAGNAQPVTMKLSSPTANDITFEWMKAFKAGAEDRSGGKLKIELYPANQLGQIPRTVEGVAMGTIEVTIPATGFLIGLEPRFQIFDAMGLFDNVEHAMKVFHDADIRRRLAGFGASKGVEPLAVFIHSPNELASRKPVRSLADIAGQKIRVPGSPLLIEPLGELRQVVLQLRVELGVAHRDVVAPGLQQDEPVLLQLVHRRAPVEILVLRVVGRVALRRAQVRHRRVQLPDRDPLRPDRRRGLRRERASDQGQRHQNDE